MNVYPPLGQSGGVFFHSLSLARVRYMYKMLGITFFLI